MDIYGGRTHIREQRCKMSHNTYISTMSQCHRTHIQNVTMSQNTYTQTDMQNVTDLVADLSVGKKQTISAPCWGEGKR